MDYVVPQENAKTQAIEIYSEIFAKLNEAGRTEQCCII